MFLLNSKKLAKKIEKLNLETPDLFLKSNALLNKKVRQISSIDLDISSLKEMQHFYDYFVDLFPFSDDLPVPG